MFSCLLLSSLFISSLGSHCNKWQPLQRTMVHQNRENKRLCGPQSLLIYLQQSLPEAQASQQRRGGEVRRARETGDLLYIQIQMCYWVFFRQTWSDKYVSFTEIMFSYWCSLISFWVAVSPQSLFFSTITFWCDWMALPLHEGTLQDAWVWSIYKTGPRFSESQLYTSNPHTEANPEEVGRWGSPDFPHCLPIIHPVWARGNPLYWGHCGLSLKYLKQK